MSRHFGNPTRGPDLHNEHLGLAPGATLNKHANTNVHFLPVRQADRPAHPTRARMPTSFSNAPRHWTAQLAIDCAAVAAGVTFTVVTAGAIVASLFLMFFCRF